VTVYSTTVLAIFIATWLLARFRGGPPERIAGTILIVWIGIDFIYHRLFGSSGFSSVDPVHLLLDGAQLAAIGWVALNANRMWPLWAAAAALITFSGHVAVLIHPDGMSQAYWAVSSFPQWIQIAALLLGVIAHARRLRKLGGPYRSWRKA
jgi:hypothetical protein